VQRNIRELKQKSANRIAGKETQPRLRVLQPDLADSFRKAKAALEDATRDIAELRRRAGRLGRR
jgi:hypothetical protein